MTKVILHETDYVLLKEGKPLEELNVIYHYSSVVELFNDGFILNKGEEFVSMSDLSEEVKCKYIKILSKYYDE